MEVGPHGSLQTVADMIKLLGKQILTPVATDQFVYLLAPLLVFVPTLCLTSLIPLSGAEAFANLPYGLVILIALSGISVLAIFMAGWASNNKYAVLGGMRSVSQVIAYEIPILLAALSVVMIAQTLNLRQIVEAQGRGMPVRPAPAGRRRALLHRHHRRDQPRPVRHPGGGIGAGGRIPHRVLGDAVRDVLLRRVHQHAGARRRWARPSSSAGGWGRGCPGRCGSCSRPTRSSS